MSVTVIVNVCNNPLWTILSPPQLSDEDTEAQWTSQPSELMGNRSKICIQTQSAMPRVSICAWKADSRACAPPCDLMILTTCGGRIGEGNGTPLQYSCLENPMDGGAWKAAVHGVAEGQARLSDFTFTFHFHALEKEMAATPVFQCSQGWGSLVTCCPWGSTESDTTEAT